jgi:hypothetical protein
MSTKHYCNECKREIHLPGNGRSQTTYGRSPGKEDGWKIEFQIHREYNGGRDDLCVDCCVKIMKSAIGHMI